MIARNSVFTYKGKPVKVQQVSEELGVRYVLEGSTQRSGDRLRITAQLIDAETGNHLWAESYDRDMKDLFDLQDDITKNVVTALQVKLTQGDIVRIYGKGTKNLKAYLKTMKGLYHVTRYKRDDNETARRLFEEALKLDPNYAGAYVALAWSYFLEADLGWTKTPGESYKKAMELAKKAVSLDEKNAIAYLAIAYVYLKTGQSEKAVGAQEKALALDPANSLVNAIYGLTLIEAGKFKEAIPFFKRAIRIDPKSPSWYLLNLGIVYSETGKFKEAIPLIKKAMRIDPQPPIQSLLLLGWAYFWTFQGEEAIAAFKKCLSLDPENAFAHASSGCAFIAAGDLQEAITMLEKALSLDPSRPDWYVVNLSIARFGTGQPEEAITTLQKVLNRDPDNAVVCRGMAWLLTHEGKHEEALSMAKKAVSLKELSPGPEPVFVFYTTLGVSHYMMGEYEEAIAAYKKAISLQPEAVSGHIRLTAACSLASRMEEARAQAAEVLRINPKITLEDIAKNGFFNYKKADKERFINALRKAGLK